MFLFIFPLQPGLALTHHVVVSFNIFLHLLSSSPSLQMSTTDPTVIARVATATSLSLARAEFYLDAAGGDEEAAVALWRGD